MTQIKITAKYKKWPEGIDLQDDTSKNGVYRVRQIWESNTGKKYVHVWGWADSAPIEQFDLMINGKVVEWI